MDLLDLMAKRFVDLDLNQIFQLNNDICQFNDMSIRR